MPLVEAARYFDSLEAGLARSVLAEAGIESVLFDFDAANIWGSALIPIRLMVLDEDLDMATRTLA